MADKNTVTPQPPISKIFEEVPTNTSIETSNFIFLNINGRDIGLVQEVNADQKRPVHWVYELSNLSPVEAVPGRFTGTLTIKRVMSYYYEAMDAINYLKSLSDAGLVPEDPTAMYHLAYAVTPIDVMLKFKMPANTTTSGSTTATLTDNKLITKTYRECWITGLTFSVNADTDTRIIVESITFGFRDIIQNALRPGSNNTEYYTNIL